MVPLDHLRVFSRSWTGSSFKALCNRNLGVRCDDSHACVLPVRVCRLQQSFAAGSPVIFGLDFDEGGREQGCRNLGSLTVPARYSKKEYIIYQNKRNYFNSTSYSFLLNLSLNLSVLVYRSSLPVSLWMSLEDGSYLCGQILVTCWANTIRWSLSLWRTQEDENFCPHRRWMLNHFPI